MGTLKKGSKVKMKAGGEAVILDELGSGGQGTVYKVSYNGKEYALKWYHKDVFSGRERAFYQNLENNIIKGAPNTDFLWPLGISEVQAGVFGYIMDIRPSGYHELTEFFVGSKTKKQIRFRSFKAVADAAINIIQAFRELHKRGYSYQDINNGNFFINPDNGKVLICDNDNVAPFGTNTGIQGKQRYMAPEIVTGGNPDTNSDWFSMAVILFRLLFINHPLEGMYSTPPCMTKELERKYYGTEPIFVYDPADNRNRPVIGTDSNLKIFWRAYPDYIKEKFTYAFSKEVMHKQKPRVIEQEWLDVFMRLKASIVKCPKCGEETFVVNTGENICINCGNVFRVDNSIRFNSTVLPLYPGVEIMLWNVDSSQNDIMSKLGLVVANPSNPKLFGIKNVSGFTWRVDLPNSSQKFVETGAVVPIRKDFIIHCTNNINNTGIII